MIMVVTPTHIRYGKEMHGYRVRCADQLGEMDIQTIARNQASAASIVRAWIEGRDWLPCKGSIAGWTDCDGPDLEPEAA